MLLLISDPPGYLSVSRPYSGVARSLEVGRPLQRFRSGGLPRDRHAAAGRRRRCRCCTGIGGCEAPRQQCRRRRHRSPERARPRYRAGSRPGERFRHQGRRPCRARPSQAGEPAALRLRRDAALLGGTSPAWRRSRSANWLLALAAGCTCGPTRRCRGCLEIGHARTAITCARGRSPATALTGRATGANGRRAPGSPAWVWARATDTRSATTAKARPGCPGWVYALPEQLPCAREVPDCRRRQGRAAPRPAAHRSAVTARAQASSTVPGSSALDSATVRSLLLPGLRAGRWRRRSPLLARGSIIVAAGRPRGL